MKKKHFIAPALALGLIGGAIAVPSAIFADSDAAVTDSATSSAVTQDAGKTTTGDHVVTPNATTPRIENRPISGTTYLADFDIKANYGYVRLYLKNTGKKPISFTINQGSPGGRQKASGSVEPGDTYNEIVNESSGPWAVGTFYVNLTSGSAPMEGQLGVRISTDTNF